MSRWFVVIIACLLVAPPAMADAPEISLDQGMSPELRALWYRTPQGSELIPYDWFIALEQADNDRPFQSDEVMKRFGYIPEKAGNLDIPMPAEGQYNPDGLPVGFAKGKDSNNREWLGFTCAACHTSQIEHKGKSFRVDGATGMADLVPFRDALIAAVRATMSDPAKFHRFASQVTGYDRKDQLKSEMQAYLDVATPLADRSRPKYPAGPARVDAFSILINEMIGTVPEIPENYRTPAAPVSYPFLWGAPFLEWVQWNGAVQDAMARNDGEVLIVFGHASATVNGKDIKIQSSGMIKNLHDLEEWTKDIKPPRWPEAILGTIDPVKAAKGEQIYLREKCDTCHANKPPYPISAPNQFGKTFVKVCKTPISELKTDPLAAVNFADRSAKTGKFAPMFGGAPEVPAYAMFFLNLLSMTDGDENLIAATKEQKVEYSGYRVDVLPKREDLLVYKSGPLAGIWATAPYLHNGSVPDLYQLLLPSGDRVKVWHVGTREYDPIVAGYDSRPRPGLFEFRTEVPGNSNSGHDYGTRITDAERWALVEYLKTL